MRAARFTAPVVIAGLMSMAGQSAAQSNPSEYLDLGPRVRAALRDHPGHGDTQLWRRAMGRDLVAGLPARTRLDREHEHVGRRLVEPRHVAQRRVVVLQRVPARHRDAGTDRHRGCGDAQHGGVGGLRLERHEAQPRVRDEQEDRDHPGHRGDDCVPDRVAEDPASQRHVDVQHHRALRRRELQGDRGDQRQHRNHAGTDAARATGGHVQSSARRTPQVHSPRRSSPRRHLALRASLRPRRPDRPRPACR